MVASRRGESTAEPVDHSSFLLPDSPAVGKYFAAESWIVLTTLFKKKSARALRVISRLVSQAVG
jgi:hypothetical protein